MAIAHFIHLSVDRYLNYFYFLAIMSNNYEHLCKCFLCVVQLLSYLDHIKRMNQQGIVGNIMALQGCPCLNPQNQWICYLTWQRGLYWYDWGWGLHDGENILDYQGGTNLI